LLVGSCATGSHITEVAPLHEVSTVATAKHL